MAPPPADDLLAYYREAEATFGVPWQVLAAVNLVETGLGQRVDIGPALNEAQEIGPYRHDRRLLQHDFAEPHPVGIGSPARRRAPRHYPAMTVVPGEQFPPQDGRIFQRELLGNSHSYTVY